MIKEDFKYSIFETVSGWVGVLASAKGLRRLTFPLRSMKEARGELFINGNDAILAPGLFGDFAGRLRAYFGGREVSFNNGLDLSGATGFQKDVWTAARLIPYGETRSYAWVARQVGQPLAARAVGQALGRNPLPVVIPCHRVIASDGGLCGFGGGLEMKKFLLSLETGSASSSPV